MIGKYQKEVIDRQYNGRMRSKRLRKKLYKYHYRYFKPEGKTLMQRMGSVFKFHYTDVMEQVLSEPQTSFLKSLPKQSEWKGAYVPVPLVISGTH